MTFVIQHPGAMVLATITGSAVLRPLKALTREWLAVSRYSRSVTTLLLTVSRVFVDV
jgi:hypothetical protein